MASQEAAPLPINVIIPLLLLALVPVGYGIGASASCLTVPVIFAAFALLEIVVGVEGEERPIACSSPACRLPIWIYIPAQLAMILWGISAASRTAGVAAAVALAVSMGTTAGVFGMLAAHEMIHSRRRAERILGLAMLAGVTYMQFGISHLHGHHRLAATHDDPATARRGESAYRFVLRSAVGQLAQAWRHERRRRTRRAWATAANRVHRYLAFYVASYGAVAALFGWRSVVFQLVQSVTAVFILELFNYVAHYGLVRRRSLNGGFEPLGLPHSWNAAHRLDNRLLFNAGRHTHHHRAPSLPYENLRAVESTPRLPFGFAGSILLALVPPLWRRVMDPKVDYWTPVSTVGTRSPLATPTS